MFLYYKLKAGALQMTLFIIVVIALLLASFILFMKLNAMTNTKINGSVERIRLATQGINYAYQNKTPLSDSIELRLHSNLDITTLINRKYWGVFEQVAATSKIKASTFRKTALIGGKLTTENRMALYIPENNKPLVLVGDSKIEGTAYVSKKGIRAGNISGHSYYGGALLYGNQHRSETNLPELSNDLKEHLKRFESNSNRQATFEIESTESLTNSFLDPVKSSYSSSTVVLDRQSISGHIIIESESKIIVEQDAKLKDVILKAPIIIVRDGVKGNFQVIAQDSILVGENCKLDYPSALVVRPNIRSNSNALDQSVSTSIQIADNTTMKGIIISLSNVGKRNYNAQVQMKTGTALYGEVYCSGHLELEGTIYGSVYATMFVAHQNGSAYQNHIYNGKVLANDLPEYYSGLVLNDTEKNIMQWLY